MKLDKLAAIAEIVSSLAIVVTLAFLTVQTREMALQTAQTNSALIANSRAASMTADVNLMLAAFARAPEGNRTNFFAAFFRIREFAWFQYQSGILDQATWESYIGPVPDMFNNNPEVRSWWEENSHTLNPSFVAAINQAAGRE
jgi:hypothetical protein